MCLNLLFQSVSNIPKGVIGGDWTLSSLAVCEHGVVAIDFEAYVVSVEERRQRKAGPLRACFSVFFKSIRTFCVQAKLRELEISHVLHALNEWREDMCHAIDM